MKSLKCSICGAPAVVHLQQIVDGVERSIDLCEICARSYGVLPNDMSPFSVVKNISAALFSHLGISEGKHTCQRCGSTLESLKKNGKLGCVHCYENLKDDLKDVLGNMQKSLKHIGKRPKNFQELEPSTQEDTLVAQLQKAIQEERFEDAAIIRDKIRSNDHESN